MKVSDLMERTVKVQSVWNSDETWLIDKNPPFNRMVNILAMSEQGSLRGLTDENDIYFMDAYLGIHNDMKRALELNKNNQQLHLGVDNIDDEISYFPVLESEKYGLRIIAFDRQHAEWAKHHPYIKKMASQEN